MIKQDDQSYTFVVTRSSSNRIQARRITISKRFLQAATTTAIMILGFAFYNFSGSDQSFDNSHLAKVSQHIQSNKYTSGLFIQSVSGNNLPAKHKGKGGPVESFVEDSDSASDLREKIKAYEEMLRSRESLPSIYPLIGKINNEFGMRRNPFGGRSTEHHSGMDIGGDKGDPVIAPGDGIVIKAGWQGGYGNLIEVSHGNNLTTRYGHLSQIEVEAGQTISRGQQIGRVGSTGRSTGPHLHYEVRINNEAVDPRGYLPPEPTSITE
jgi:murein DD-endopeptidase MepM/ murein hydrolase activator NlpD